MSEILNLSALCRCCHADGNFRSLGVAYNSENGVEMYSAMFQETFNITLSSPPIDASYAICDVCIFKLRDGYQFKLQVLDCEEKFYTYCQNELALTNATVKTEHECDTENELEEKSLDLIKIDESSVKCDDDDNYNDFDDDCKDEEPKNKATHKTKKSNIKTNKPRGRPKKIKRGRPKKVRDAIETKKYTDEIVPLKEAKLPLKEAEVPLKDVKVPLNAVIEPLKEVKVPSNDNDCTIDMANVKVKEEADDEASEVPKIEDVSQEELPVEPKTEKLKRYKCNYNGCVKHYFALKSLNRHRKETHSDVSLKGVGFKDEVNNIIRSMSPISEIIKTNSGDLIACKTCGQSFQNNEQLNSHLSKEHGGTLKCPKCKNFYKDKYNLRLHLIKIHFKRETEPLKCEYCEKTFPTKVSLKAHENIHTRKRIYICDICNKESVHRTSFTKHIMAHVGTLKRFYCDKCGQGCNDSTNLRIHIQTVHEKLKNFDCHLCGKKFSLRKSLKAHLSRHEGVVPMKNVFFVKNGVNIEKKCSVCFESFVDKFKYWNHMRKHRFEYRKFKCDLCNSHFGTWYSLKRHLDTHSGEKKFSCPLCPAHFSQKSTVPRHVRNVHKKRNFEKIKCLTCNKFVNDIEKHTKGHEVKPFACDLCDKRYPAKNALNRHIGVMHLGRGKHECGICKKSYIDLSKLRTHLKKKHSIEEPKVEIDNYDATLPSYAIKTIVPYSVDIEKA